MELIVPDMKIDFKELISGFAFPLDIKNDIIYCQKSLRTYIKVHQIIVTRMGNNIKLSSVRKNLDDIEKEICEINAEQKLLLIRLRCALEEYYISLRNDNVEIDHEIGNGYISRMFSGCIEDPNYLCEPITVKRRQTEKELLMKSIPEDHQKKMPETVDIIRSFVGFSRQVSLLKPKAERFAQTGNSLISINISDVKEQQQQRINQQLQQQQQQLQQLQQQQQQPPQQQPSKSEDKEQENKPLTLTSPAINSSRMRLLQALQKAQTMNALKTIQQSSLSTKRKYDASSPTSSISDGSPDTRETSPSLSDEPSEPTDYTQETFLKVFGLYTLEHSKYLTQRRSKRKRRNVQNNEKSEYHYGNFDLLDNSNAGQRQEKKKKIFLPAAPSTRGRKRKIDSDRDTATSSKVSSDRSLSSSPTEEKVHIICSECCKEGDSPLTRCENCNGVFHIKCHKGSILKQPMKLREKCCPLCFRIKQRDNINKDLQQQQQQQQEPEQQTPSDNGMPKLRKKGITLIENRNKFIEEYNELQEKFKTFYIRKQGLKKRSDMFKSNINRLFHIVKTYETLLG